MFLVRSTLVWIKIISAVLFISTLVADKLDIVGDSSSTASQRKIDELLKCRHLDFKPLKRVTASACEKGRGLYLFIFFHLMRLWLWASDIRKLELLSHTITAAAESFFHLGEGVVVARHSMWQSEWQLLKWAACSFYFSICACVYYLCIRNYERPRQKEILDEMSFSGKEKNLT